MSNNSIGSFLAALRKANGMTQKQLAEKLNVSDKAISRWERDECAPDLSLIPVLAEIYGVTSDEILRGQRANPNAEPTPQAEEKSKKRLQHLLDQNVTNYRIRSLISTLIAAVGVIVAMILNLGFQRAHLGFLCGGIFFVAAAICQAIFSVQSHAALQNEEFPRDAVQSCRHSLLRQSEKTYSLIVILFSATLPLTQVEDAYWGLPFYSWLALGIFFPIAAALLCLLVCKIINIRQGLIPKPDWRSPLNQLRLRSLGIAVVLLLVTYLLNGFFGVWLDANPQLYSDVTRFDDFDSFSEYMEQPISYDGEKLSYLETRYDSEDRQIQIYLDSESNEYWYYSEYIAETITDPDGNILCSYNRYNDNAGYITYSFSDTRLPIYVQTTEQRHAANEIFNSIMLAWIPVYLAEIIIVILRYRKKKAQLT